MIFHHLSATLLVAAALVPVGRTQYVVPTFANFTGPNGPLVDLGYIKLQGTNVTSAPIPMYAWAGVRYGADPSGEYRFKAARPIEAVTKPNTTFDASTYGPYCFQGFSGASPEKQTLANFQIGNRVPGEDCLTLDIYAPAKPVSAKLPVFVSIHGGAYTQGVGTQIPLNPWVSAAPNRFIFISMQYRLSGFGFLGGEDVRQHGSLNVGLLDQRQALHWIQRHISAFGGDPDRVTIQGPSAGGGSVTYHYFWNGGEDYPPFQRGIAEYPWWEMYLNSSQLEVQYRQVLSATNCNDIHCLRQVPGDVYARAQQSVMDDWTKYPYGTNYFGPTIDGTYLRDLPSNEARAGHVSKVPLIISHNSNEGQSFTALNITTEALVQSRLQSLVNGGPNFFGRANDYYPPTESGLYAYNGTQQRADYIYGDIFAQCPTYYLASALTDAYARANISSWPVYKYIYALPTFQTAGHGNSGALYGPFPDNDTSPAAVLSRTFMSYYTSFLIDGDPNSGAVSKGLAPSLKWPQYGADSQIFLLNDTHPYIVHDVDASPRCDFWWAHSYNTRN